MISRLKNCSFIVLIGGIFFIGQGRAETGGDTSFSIGEIIVTGVKDRPLRNILTSVDIMGADVAQRQNVDSTFKLLSRMPGVLVTDFHQGGTNGAVSFRGFNAEGGIMAVKLLIDGVPSNANDGYMWMLDGVPPIDIERVEVVRGTSDARYGLHNIAGNIAIFSRVGGTYLDAKTTVGAWGTYEGQLALGRESGAFTQNYSFDYRESDGYRDRGTLRRKNAAGKWFYNGDDVRFGLIARYFTSDGNDSGFLSGADAATRPRYSPPLNADDGRDREGYSFTLQGEATLTDALTTSGNIYMTRFDDTRFFRIAPTVSQQERHLNEQQEGASLTLHYNPEQSFLHDLRIESGANLDRQDNHHQRWLGSARVRSSRVFDRRFILDVYGGYVQAVIEPTPWLKVTPAYRIDRVDGHYLNVANDTRYPVNDYGTIEQPKISAVVTPLPGLSVYGNYGRTFQIGLGVGSYIVPPQVSSLSASVNDGWEAGVKYNLGSQVESRVAVWQQTASDEIVLRNATGDFINLGRTRRRGIDAQINVRPSALVNVWGAFSWQKGIIVVPDPTTPGFAGNRIDHVPAYLVSGGIEYRPIEPLRLAATFYGQSKYELDASNSHGRFGDAALFNIEAGYQLTANIEVSVEVRNVTDHRTAYVYYDRITQSPLHSPNDGRAFYGSLRLTY
ncbi:TonB-dependent receptor plug domain-containing protein [Niveispirillum sp. SYP-B3756]|uniref:TonB-dependent receptor n=1 Tax=Niveispirillum sp. SYP-B3756 TaxID=2662178 RepID=UPI0012912138|nr:TonB-dependent receptor [Niveispirillum sp. SYP-B3756]MQP67053.1 TonB-dependent receptor plug domain-containing protein [Niveispirillum sp. SYP-B3756]